MNGWQTDREWADRFMPEIKRILGEHLISDAPPYEDQRHNTDLMIGDRELMLAAIRVGVRVRKHKFLADYPNDYTIRTARPRSGRESELSKIIRGYGDFLFYGIADASETALACWVIIDLAEWRLWFNRWIVAHNGMTPGERIPNYDGSSEFGAFRIDELPESAIKARQPALLPANAYADLPF